MNYYIKIILAVLIVFVISCEENFSPKEEFYEEYVLNCTIRGNSNFQTAAILRSFNVPGYNPEQESSNRFIEGAKVTLQYGDTTYEFKDTSMTSLLDQNFEEPLKLYYIDDFKRSESNSNMILKAILPNGKTLMSSTSFPIGFDFDFNKEYSTLYIPPRDPSLTNVNIVWVPEDYTYFQYYLVRLKIYYVYKKDGNEIEKFIEVPISSKRIDGTDYLYYPKPSRSLNISYSLDMVDKAMKMIEENEKNSGAGQISIKRWAKMEVLAINNDLAAYYFAGLSENPYTTRIDNISYSNINGGFGIFGTLWYEEANLRIQDGYIEYMGYNIAY